MESPIQKTLTSFGLFKSSNVLVALPKSLEDLVQCLDYAKKKKFQIAIKGGGNSYGDVFFNDQFVVDTKGLNSIHFFDPENGIISVGPGVRMGDLLEIIMPYNWVLVGVSGSVNDVIGGMVSANVHGKDSWKNGNFSQNILSLKIMFADGTIQEIKKNTDFELFNSVVGGLGLMGFITEITLKLKQIPSYMVEHEIHKITNFDKTHDFFYSLENYDYDYAYALINPFSTGQNSGQAIVESSKFVDKKIIFFKKYPM